MRIRHATRRAGATAVAAFAALVCACLAPTAGAAEPARRLLIDNDTLRVAEVTFEPGDAEARHTHATALVVFFVTPGRLENVRADGSVEQTGGSVGDVSYLPAGTTHLARNASQERVVVRVVALKK